MFVILNFFFGQVPLLHFGQDDPQTSLQEPLCEALKTSSDKLRRLNESNKHRRTSLLKCRKIGKEEAFHLLKQCFLQHQWLDSRAFRSYRHLQFDEGLS